MIALLFFNCTSNNSSSNSGSSNNSGESTFQNIKMIVDANGNVGEYSSIEVEGNDVYISYYDSDPNGDLKFAKSIDGGNTWAP